MRLGIVLGTRPEIIKMSPIVRACQRRGLDFFILHTGQHYSYEMDRVFFEELGLPPARHNLDVGSGTHGQQTARILERIETVLASERPDIIFVQGDTNTVLAATLAASKLGIKIGHVEAGLRSGDRSMPEETNRVVADHVSDLLFAPTEGSANNLRREGIPGHRIHLTGNTVVDAVRQNLELAKQRSDVLERLGLSPGFVLLTAHRQENVDNEKRFRGILEGAIRVGERRGVNVVYPIHPRSRKMMQSFGIETPGVRLIDPVSYLDFLVLEANASLVITDSGGVQEEACVLGVPCVTVRDNTERPETVEVGGNRLAGCDPNAIVAAARSFNGSHNGWKNPFGSGQAADAILDIVETDIDGKKVPALLKR